MDAQAILFESGLYAVLPNDIPEKLALSRVGRGWGPGSSGPSGKKEGDTVCIIGGGRKKSGVLCCYRAMKNVGPYGKVIVVEYSEENARRIKDMNLATHVIVADATKVMDVYKKVIAIAGEKEVLVTLTM